MQNPESKLSRFPVDKVELRIYRVLTIHGVKWPKGQKVHMEILSGQRYQHLLNNLAKNPGSSLVET